MKKKLFDRYASGQGMVEYALILVLVSVVVIVVLSATGTNVSGVLSKVNSSMAVTGGSGGGAVVVPPVNDCGAAFDSWAVASTSVRPTSWNFPNPSYVMLWNTGGYFTLDQSGYPGPGSYYQTHATIVGVIAAGTTCTY